MEDSHLESGGTSRTAASEAVLRLYQSRLGGFMKTRIVMHIIGIACLLGAMVSLYRTSGENETLCAISISPWTNVGGCCTPPENPDDQLGEFRWHGYMGNGGLLTTKIVGHSRVGLKAKRRSMHLAVQFRPAWTWRIGLHTALVQVEPTIANCAVLRGMGVNAGLGDMQLFAGKLFGMSGQNELQFSVRIPVGRHSQSISSDCTTVLLPSELQIGKGVFVPAVELRHIEHFGDREWTLGVVYEHPIGVYFAEDEFENTRALSSTERNSLERGYSLNGKTRNGLRVPPEAKLVFALRNPGLYRLNEQRISHWFSVEFSVPLAVGWVPDSSPGVYNPTTDPDHRTWSCELTYQLHWGGRWPIVFGFSLPIRDAADKPTGSAITERDVNQWDLPDENEILRTWELYTGVSIPIF